MAPPSNERALDEFTVDAAIAWYLKLKDESATERDRRAFRDWLARDGRHADAYREAERLWQEIEAPALLLAGQEAERERLRRVAGARGRGDGRRAWPWAAAACLAMLLAGFGLWRDPGLADRLMADLATPSGQTRETILADGSRLFLDADSAVDVTMSPQDREVTLRRGRLWVDVVADPDRPFIVTSGDVRVRVVGTRFAVERHGDRVEVTVEQGRVAVAGKPPTHDRDIVLGHDQRLVVSGGVPGVLAETDARLQLAWRRGLVIFDQAGIADVAAQLERMLPGRMLFDEARLSSLRLSGSFPGDDPSALLDALDGTLGIEVRRVPGGLVWLRLPGAEEDDK